MDTAPKPITTRLRWSLFTVLCIAGVFNAMDRPIIAILKPDMMADFGWSDSNFGDLAAVTQFSAAFAFLFTGWLFWWSVLRANPKQVPQALMAVLLTLMHTGLLGALLTFGTVSFYGEGRSVDDQQLAGLIMWVPGGLIYLIGGGWIAWRWLTRMWRRQQTGAAREELG